jgi:predicted nucleic acid-binding protein
LRALLDTAVLIATTAPARVTGAISVVSIAELHFGVLVTVGSEERARRLQRLGVIEATFDPLPVDAKVAREWGRLTAVVRDRGGGRPCKRAAGLVIAATANVHRVPLLTPNPSDFRIISDLVDVREP